MTSRRKYQSLPAEIRTAVFERDAYTCQDCGHTGVPGYSKDCVQVHHIDPYRQGGEHNLDNLITLCVPCHKRRDRAYFLACLVQYRQRLRVRRKKVISVDAPQSETGRALWDLRHVVIVAELAEEAGRDPRTVRDWVARQHARLEPTEQQSFARKLPDNAGWLINRNHPIVVRYISTEARAGRPATKSQHNKAEE